MGEDSIHKIITFGFNEGADIRITNFRNRSDDGKPLGVSFKLETMEHSVPVRIDGVFGKSQAYAAAVAAAVASVEKINLVTAAEALALYKGEKGRMRLIPGIKRSYILDDTYNASPASSRAALDVLEDLEAQRKIAVLGDMLELGKYTESAHRELGRHAASMVDKLVTVGARSIFTAEGAKESGLPKEDILSFDTSDEAKIEVQKLIEKGDLVLVKGSQGIRMERVVLEIMAEPQKAKDLLVRQYGKWLLK